jgi:hypothetical protein
MRIPTMTETTIAVRGLGEAGAVFALDLVAAGAVVRATTRPSPHRLRGFYSTPRREVPQEDFTERPLTDNSPRFCEAGCLDRQCGCVCGSAVLAVPGGLLAVRVGAKPTDDLAVLP